MQGHRRGAWHTLSVGASIAGRGPCNSSTSPVISHLSASYSNAANEWREADGKVPTSFQHDRCPALCRGRSCVFIWPVITAVVLLVVAAAWSVMSVVLKIIAAIQLLEGSPTSGSSPWAKQSRYCSESTCAPNLGRDGLALVWLMGLWALVFGITSIARGFRLRGHRAERPKAHRA
jgi:hypothetical protein